MSNLINGEVTAYGVPVGFPHEGAFRRIEFG